MLTIAFVGPVPPVHPPQPSEEPQEPNFLVDLWETLHEIFGAILIFGLVIIWNRWMEASTGSLEDEGWREEELALGVAGTCTLAGMTLSFICMVLAYFGAANEPTTVWVAALAWFAAVHGFILSRILNMKME